MTAWNMLQRPRGMSHLLMSSPFWPCQNAVPLHYDPFWIFRLKAFHLSTCSIPLASSPLTIHGRHSHVGIYSKGSGYFSPSACFLDSGSSKLPTSPRSRHSPLLPTLAMKMAKVFPSFHHLVLHLQSLLISNPLSCSLLTKRSRLIRSHYGSEVHAVIFIDEVGRRRPTASPPSSKATLISCLSLSSFSALEISFEDEDDELAALGAIFAAVKILCFNRLFSSFTSWNAAWLSSFSTILFSPFFDLPLSGASNVSPSNVVASSPGRVRVKLIVPLSSDLPELELCWNADDLLPSDDDGGPSDVGTR